MEMEGSGGSQSQVTHPAVDVDEAALAVTKRERKRSRYLSHPYTDTGVQEKKAAGSHKQREEEEQEEGPPHVSAAEVLSALRATALGQGEGMDAAALRFLAMYSSNRNRNSIFGDDHPDSHAAAGGGSQDDGVSAAAAGRNLNAGPDDESLAKKKIPHPPAAAAAAAAGANANAKPQKDAGPIEKENAAMLEHAMVTHGLASQSPGVAATATHGHPNPPPVVTTTTVTHPVNNEKKKKKRNKKRFKTVEQLSYVGNPVALVLDFAEGTPPLPSREDLLSTFSRFGFVIDSETTISQDKHTARVAFATRAQAEAALSCAATPGGAFGPPFAVASLQDLPSITLLNTPLPPPLPKLPLTDIRNNLGKMILSLSSKATAAPQEANAKTAVDSLSLVGEMQRLLAKVDKVLQVQGASATAHHA